MFELLKEPLINENLEMVLDKDKFPLAFSTDNVIGNICAVFDK